MYADEAVAHRQEQSSEHGRQASPTSVTDNALTHEEATELGRFSQGKARIEECTAILESRSPIDPFAEFRMAAKNLLSDRDWDHSQIWASLDNQRTELNLWIQERDRIEQEARDFDVADMERLRKLAKG